MLARLGQRLAGVWRWVQGLFGRSAPTFRVVPAEELPDQLRHGTLYAIGEPDAPWSAALLCPCGCGEAIQLSLLKDDRPRWSLRVDPEGRPTLHPSVWRRGGCRSHFILRRGIVEWCRDDAGPGGNPRFG